MVDPKVIERECFKFLKKEFDKVEWLSRNSYAPIDFKCYKKEICFLVEAKHSTNPKVLLSPNQHKVDAIVLHNGKNIRLLWKKDFGGFVRFSKSSAVKISDELKLKLDNIKLHRRETYSEVISRLFEYHYNRH